MRIHLVLALAKSAPADPVWIAVELFLGLPLELGDSCSFFRMYVYRLKRSFRKLMTSSRLSRTDCV